MKRARAALFAGIVTCALAAFVAEAQVVTRPRPPTRPSRIPSIPSANVAAFDAGTALRTHFGIELATTLMRSPDAAERLRGIERAAALGGTEARILLIQALASSDERSARLDPLPGAARRDGRALVAATRGLSRELQEEMRGARPASPLPTGDAGRSEAPRTLGLVNALVPVLDAPATAGRESSVRPDLLELARGIAARALALSDDPRAIEALVKAARDLDAGRPAAVAAMTALRTRAQRTGAVDLLVLPNLSRETAMLAAESSDLRAVEPLTQAVRSPDARLRAAAIASLAELGAPNAIDPAKALLRDPDPSVRLAAGGALVKLGAPEAPAVVAALLADDSTAERAAALAENVESPDVDRALFERARKPGDAAARKRMLIALGRHKSPASATALASLASDAELRSDAVGELGRSRAAGSRDALVALARDASTRRLGVRALTLRTLVHGVDRELALDLARPLATAGPVADRALYMFAFVALGAHSLETGLAERDADVRAAALMGALGRLDERACRAIAERRSTERDANVRTLLAVGFLCPRGAEGVSSNELWSRAREGGSDAALALGALAARTHERDSGEIYDFLTSGSPLLRAHVARGLGSSAREDAPGRVARALLYETDAQVRRAMVRALARSGGDTPSGREALDVIATWDPEDDVRALADAARSGAVLPELGEPRETAWLRIATREGESGGVQLAAVARSDGLSVPIAFDQDGYAVVGGLPPGSIHLMLAPRLPRLQGEAP